MARQRHRGAFVFGAVLGGLAGAAYGLWTAPRAGAETRAKLTAEARYLAQQAGEAIAALRNEGEKIVARAGAAIAAQVERVRAPEPAAPTAQPQPQRPPTTDEVIAASPLPPVEAPPTDEVIEGPYPTMDNPPPQAGG